MILQVAFSASAGLHASAAVEEWSDFEPTSVDHWDDPRRRNKAKHYRMKLSGAGKNHRDYYAHDGTKQQAVSHIPMFPPIIYDNGE